MFTSIDPMTSPPTRSGWQLERSEICPHTSQPTSGVTSFPFVVNAAEADGETGARPEMLQVTEQEEEAYELLKRHVERSISESTVAVFNRNNSEDRLEDKTAVPPESRLHDTLAGAKLALMDHATAGKLGTNPRGWPLVTPARIHKRSNPAAGPVRSRRFEREDARAGRRSRRSAGADSGSLQVRRSATAGVDQESGYLDGLWGARISSCSAVSGFVWTKAAPQTNASAAATSTSVRSASTGALGSSASPVR